MGKEICIPGAEPKPKWQSGPKSQVLSLDPSFNQWDSSSLTQLLRDNDDDGDEDEKSRDDDNDNDNDDDNNNNNDDDDDDDEDDLIDVDDDDNLMHLQNFDLNDIEGMSEYELMRMQRVPSNNMRLASLGLLEPMMPAASLSSDRSNSKKHSAPQDDVERWVQPTSNAKQTTSYRDLDNYVIYKRTRPSNSSDTGEEDIVRKRIREDEAE
jgi:hypothetical protein